MVEQLTAPDEIPPAPIPAMALAMIKVMELGAAPHRADPASNSIIDDINTALMSKERYSLPNISWNAQFVSEYAVPYQPISPAELNSLVI